MRRAPTVFAATLVLAACGFLDGGGGDGDRQVKVGSSVSGTLADSDPALRGNRGRHHIWTMKGKRGQRLIIDLASSSFDTYLYLRDAEGFLMGSDDDGGGNRNARVRAILPRNGTYRIVATSFGTSARGDYTLTVTEWPTLDAPGAGATSSLSVGDTKDGLLEPGDEFSGDGPYQDRWTFELDQGQRARVEMRSSDVDAYLIVLDPDGATLTTNDDANGRDAAAYVRAARAGRYTALATTYGDAPRVGAYRMALIAVTGDMPEPGAARAILDGQTLDGQLEPGDSATGNGGFADAFTFQPTRGGLVTIDLTGTIDTYLTLQDSAGVTLATDDDGGDGTNARLTYMVTPGARYRVLASTYGSGQRSGQYRLSVLVGPQ